MIFARRLKWTSSLGAGKPKTFHVTGPFSRLTVKPGAHVIYYEHRLATVTGSDLGAVELLPGAKLDVRTTAGLSFTLHGGSQGGRLHRFDGDLIHADGYLYVESKNPIPWLQIAGDVVADINSPANQLMAIGARTRLNVHSSFKQVYVSDGATAEILTGPNDSRGSVRATDKIKTSTRERLGWDEDTQPTARVR
ncbi:MAG: hypothetical protein ACT4TC_18875 [Myxococcaceae bacterium]